MNIMIDRPRKLTLLAVIAAGILPVAAAHAHWDGISYAEPAPLYPYSVKEEEPYAVELAPNVYAVPYRLRAHPYVHCLDGCGRRAPIAQWRGHGPGNRAVIDTTEIVREAPIVIETERVVDDPPRVIERRHVEEGAPAPGQPAITEDRDTGRTARRDGAKRRVIQADAEVTILEPDRMIIRLFRKRPGPDAKEPADE
jgi:hypothetical protein